MSRISAGLRVPSIDEISYLISRIDTSTHERDKALFGFLYLSAARIGEVVRKITKEQVKFVVYRDKPFMRIEHVLCEKRRGEIHRVIPSPIWNEKEITGHIISWMEKMPPNKPLFRISRQRAWTIINKKYGLYNHYFRHCRLTHLVTVYGYNDQELTKYAGWVNSKMASTYSHLMVKDLMDKAMRT